MARFQSLPGNLRFCGGQTLSARFLHTAVSIPSRESALLRLLGGNPYVVDNAVSIPSRESALLRRRRECFQCEAGEVSIPSRESALLRPYSHNRAHPWHWRFNPFQGICASAAMTTDTPPQVSCCFNPFQGICASAAGYLSIAVFSGQ